MTIIVSSASPVLLLEHWKPIPSYEGFYEISNMGRVWSIAQGRDLHAKPYNRLYLRVKLSKNGVRKRHLLHTLVARAFLGSPPPGLITNHLDGHKPNCRLSNLEYCTDLQNKHHAMKSGLLRRKLEFSDIPRIRELAKTRSVISIAEEFGLNRSNVYQILRGEIWSHVV